MASGPFRARFRADFFPLPLMDRYQGEHCSKEEGEEGDDGGVGP